MLGLILSVIIKIVWYEFGKYDIRGNYNWGDIVLEKYW